MRICWFCLFLSCSIFNILGLWTFCRTENVILCSGKVKSKLSLVLWNQNRNQYWKKKKKIAPAKGFLFADREPKQGSDSTLRVTGEGTHRLLSHLTASKMSRFWLPLLSSQDKGKHHDTAKDVPGQWATTETNLQILMCFILQSPSDNNNWRIRRWWRSDGCKCLYIVSLLPAFTLIKSMHRHILSLLHTHTHAYTQLTDWTCSRHHTCRSGQHSDCALDLTSKPTNVHTLICKCVYMHIHTFVFASTNKCQTM